DGVRFLRRGPPTCLRGPPHTGRAGKALIAPEGRLPGIARGGLIAYPSRGPIAPDATSQVPPPSAARSPCALDDRGRGDRLPRDRSESGGARLPARPQVRDLRADRRLR